jgi:DNA integrity scanning protein DisA with diadenylate cyclase activity
MTTCIHLEQFPIISPKTPGCEECLQSGEEWVHLRMCLVCGHVGCCDESKNKHATAHFRSTQHPVIKSFEPDEGWRWCYLDQVLVTDDLVQSSAVAPSTNGGGGMFSSICQRVRRCDKKNLEPLIELAVEIAREGREGRRIGTLFTFGDADRVLKHSRSLILDPLAGHTEQARRIQDINLRGTVKELAQLDGAFVVSDQGVVVSACRYLNAMASDVVLPYGMASRHLAGASISQVTDAVAIVVSESSMVRVFDDGKLVAEIIPELWLMDHHNVQLSRPYEEERVGDLAVFTAKG